MRTGSSGSSSRLVARRIRTRRWRRSACTTRGWRCGAVIPLAEFGGEEWARAEISRLTALRTAAIEERVTLRLVLGHHAELVAELEDLTARYPLQERLHGRLMLALYRSGRQADALAAYQRLRQTLDDELGLEPSAELRALEQAILRQDAKLSAPAAGSSDGAAQPAGPADLVRRPRPELAEVRRLLGAQPAGDADRAGRRGQDPPGAARPPRRVTGRFADGVVAGRPGPASPTPRWSPQAVPTPGRAGRPRRPCEDRL